VQEPDLALFTPMSPEAFRPFDGVPGCCGIARDEHFRLVWCNAEYARLNNKSTERMVGQTLSDILPPVLAEERMSFMRQALEQGTMVAYQQVWLGVRWLTRVWPLDPAAFGHPGYFVIMSRLNEPIPTGPEAGGVRFTRSADLGDLGVLSPRELEIYYYLAAGMTAGDIAQALHRSEKTIGRHVENIHRKMLYSSRAELVRDAVQRGLIAFTGKEWLDLVDPRRDGRSHDRG
jgi:DNA-binding CsgD family transcriptional regulator